MARLGLRQAVQSALRGAGTRSQHVDDRKAPRKDVSTRSKNSVRKTCMKRSSRRKRYGKTTIDAASDQHPSGFATLDDAFQWPDLYMKRIAKRFGVEWLCKRLRAWRWTFSTAFSGVGAPESAVTSLEMAARNFLKANGARLPTHSKVLFEFTCEIDTHCRKVLKNTYNMPCNFPDITAFDSRKKTQFCSTHDKMCKVQKHRRENRLDVNAAGPICTIFSKMGGQLGVDDPRFPTHSSYYKQMKRIHSVLLVENVPEYQSDIPSSELGPSWTTEDEVIDPRNFGVPCARARRYFLAYDTDKVKRRDDVTLQEVLEALLSRNVATADMFMWMDLPPSKLSSCQERNLAEYRKLDAPKRFPDLSQYARNGRARGECSDKSLCTLTTSTRLFSEDHQRFVASKELLSSQLLPTTEHQSALCRAPMLRLKDVPESQQSKMAGNSMNTACVGAFLLAAILIFEAK